MPLPIDVTPYSLGGVIGGDSYLTHYKATGENGDDFVITEFYPAYMVSRDDSGVLNVSDRFMKEFTVDCEEFVRRATACEEIRDASLHPVVEVFERNNTAYIVRRACGMVTVDQFMSGQQMEYLEAFHFIRPALLSLAQAAEKGATFGISPQDFRVNPFKQLVVCAPPVWETDFHPTLVQIARLYYKLVTGVEAPDKDAPGFNVFGLEIPPRIENTITEILSGDILYGSLDDFYKRFKALMDSNSEADPNASKGLKKVLQGLIAVLIVILILAVGFMVNRGIRAYTDSYFWANPEVFARPGLPPPPQHDFSAVTLTHPRNVSDAVGGSFSHFGGFIFFRDYEGMLRRRVADIMIIPGAAGVLGAAEDTVIIEGVRPSFIVGHGDYIFFVDTASDGAIYRAQANGDNLTRITDFPALNLAVLGNGLFYTHAGYNHYLFRMDLTTGHHEIIWRRPVFAIYPVYFDNVVENRVEERLFVMVGEPGTPDSGLSKLNISNITSDTLVGGVRHGLRVFNDIIYYLDMYGYIRSITQDGREIAVHSPRNVRSFDVFFQWIVFTEEGRHVPRAYNKDTGQIITLSNIHWVSYVWLYESYIYALDHRNPDRVHLFALPG
ncbi:MAG: DUF5050 domain-containing protein [Defluviitaleaceae bacterium]|nr:DUF5050 domain-containing protein [Defluviitaleaceae bacterium]